MDKADILEATVNFVRDSRQRGKLINSLLFFLARLTRFAFAYTYYFLKNFPKTRSCVNRLVTRRFLRTVHMPYRIAFYWHEVVFLRQILI